MPKRWTSIAGIVLFLGAVFCGGFVFFHSRMHHSELPAPDPSKSLINKPFPHAQLIDTQGSKIDDQIFRTGKVVVVFITMDCDACKTESNFLQAFVNRRKDVAFYGLVPFGKPSDSAEAAAKLFPFRVFYDESNAYVAHMGINRVPVKVFLEDGIIKKGWIGAALSDKAKSSFVEWLDSLQ